MSNLVKSTDKLDSMVGNEFMYNASTYKMRGYATVNGHIKILTDSNDLVFDKKNIDKKLEEFLPVEAGFGSKEIRRDARKLNKLEDELYDNIEKIKNDKDFIPQAKAMTDTVNTIVSMEKLKIQMLKEIR